MNIVFGDAVEPGVEDIDLPVLLDMHLPHLRAYPQETVIAEKFHTMAVLGMVNSRMEDYYDVWMLTSAFEIDPSGGDGPSRRRLPVAARQYLRSP